MSFREFFEAFRTQLKNGPDNINNSRSFEDIWLTEGEAGIEKRIFYNLNESEHVTKNHLYRATKNKTDEAWQHTFTTKGYKIPIRKLTRVPQFEQEPELQFHDLQNHIEAPKPLLKHYLTLLFFGGYVV